MTRKEARDAVFGLLFETEFQPDKEKEEVFACSCENREIAEDSYIRAAYFGVWEHCEELDALLEKHSNGWKVYRLSRVSRAAMRLCTYEMKYTDVPKNVAINEAIELIKKYDEPKARAFANGVLNAVKNALADEAAAPADGE
jgi:N utilization substance protein B